MARKKTADDIRAQYKRIKRLMYILYNKTVEPLKAENDYKPYRQLFDIRLKELEALAKQKLSDLDGSSLYIVSKPTNNQFKKK